MNGLFVRREENAESDDDDSAQVLDGRHPRAQPREALRRE